jgi:4'-phosphopantetheinyl transferase
MPPIWPEPSEFPMLSGDALHVWAVPLDRGRATSTTLDERLSPDERDRADGFALVKPRQTFVAGRVALRSLLGEYLQLPPEQVPIVLESNGKPRLVGGDVRFNLAHSGNLALVAVTRGCEIGVDVELVRPIDHAHEIAARNFHAAEQAAIRVATAAELPAIFMRLWTRKEAVLKALGTGLGYPLDAFDTAVDESGGGGWISLPAHGSLADCRCWLQDIDAGSDYRAAVATLEPRQPPLGFTYPL